MNSQLDEAIVRLDQAEERFQKDGFTERARAELGFALGYALVAVAIAIQGDEEDDEE